MRWRLYRGVTVGVKYFEEQRDLIQEAIEKEKGVQAESSRKISHLLNRLEAVEEDIKSAIAKERANQLQFSDHAIVRYLERVHKFNMDTIKAEMASERVRNNIAKLGAGHHPSTNRHGDFILVVRENKVITVLSKEDDAV